MAKMSDVETNVKIPILEPLAALCHEQWTSWMQYLFAHGTLNDDSTFTIDADKARRWARQVCTPYNKLSEQEKEDDRIEARKFLALIVEHSK